MVIYSYIMNSRGRNPMKSKITKKDVYKIAIANRERQFHHHDYRRHMRVYELIMLGDLRAVELFRQFDIENEWGHLSDNPLRNEKYLFICSTTHTTNYAIQGGLDAETAYNISDLFIQRMDELHTIDEVRNLKYEMVDYFVKQVASVPKEAVFSPIIVQCLDYIDRHLHETVTLDDLADHVNRNARYLSTLFKKEMHINFSDYVKQQRIAVAKQMLGYTNREYVEIGNALGFSSQSYFIKVFRQETGFTPKEYRRHFYMVPSEPG